MKRIIDLKPDEAQRYFLKGTSYLNLDLPKYIGFGPLIGSVNKVMSGKSYLSFGSKPNNLPDVNYRLDSNKDGKFAWRPHELMHPVIYVSLANLICEPNNWNTIVKRFKNFEKGVVQCCSIPVRSGGIQTDKADQVTNWWSRVEQKSLECSLKFSHVLHTDVTDCYGSLYTHSIPWALHGRKKAKNLKGDKSLLGNEIDIHLSDSRFGQTNGICQGSVLMDFIAELVLGYVDKKIGEDLAQLDNFIILRYRDDYRIFTNSDARANLILKSISDKLRIIGMKLGVSKTHMSTNIVEGSIKPDKLAGINFEDLGRANAKTIQKQLIRLHAFGQRFPNSGALRRFLSDMQTTIRGVKNKPTDLGVQVAIATDIGFVSPSTFPAVAGILSHLISLADEHEKRELWQLVHSKMKNVPNNGHLEIWLQRVTENKAVQLSFQSKERLCRIVNGENVSIWNSDWITNRKLKKALSVKNIVVGSKDALDEVVDPSEIALFKESSLHY